MSTIGPAYPAELIECVRPGFSSDPSTDILADLAVFLGLGFGAYRRKNQTAPIAA
jgi:hypothetical protein